VWRGRYESPPASGSIPLARTSAGPRWLPRFPFNARYTVAASRSRTDHWRDCLRKVYERGGALEITVDRGQSLDSEARGVDLAWRVKIVHMRDDAIIVEPPAACGATIPLSPNVRLIAAMTIGQNRWMFHTTTMGHTQSSGASGSSGRLLVLKMPEIVERCTRRDFFRISTVDLRLPTVQCWPLLDPTTVIAAESANRAQINDLTECGGISGYELEDPDSILLPEVGPMFKAHLLNISGGGLGLMLRPEEGRALSSRPFLWLRVDLRPEIAAPIGVTVRMAHTHIDSGHNLYAGMAFDFSHNTTHRQFVVDLFSGYSQRLQLGQPAQLARAA
jgi:hypothetical protein